MEGTERTSSNRMTLCFILLNFRCVLNFCTITPILIAFKEGLKICLDNGTMINRVYGEKRNCA